MSVGPRRNRIRGATAVVLVGGSFLSVMFAPPGNEAAWRPTEAAAPAAVPETLPESRDAAIATAPQVAATKPHGADEIELCGGVWLKLDANGFPDQAELSRLTQEPNTRARILDRMRLSPSELARTAALVLSIFDDDERRLATLGVAPPCEAADCPVSESAKEQAMRSLDAVARTALSTTDPKVYAFAFGLCAGKTLAAAGTCRMLSAEQWSRLDPGNAAPWQHILGAAKERGDMAAQEEALFRIANAPRSDVGFFAAADAVLAAAPNEDASVLASWGLVTEALGVAAAGVLPGYQPMVAMCKGDALKDANRLQTCVAAAEALSERSDTMIGRMIGVAIGKQVGWPVARSDRMRGEYESYGQSLSSETADVMGLGCAAMRHNFALVRRNAAIGETGALREWVAASGKTPEDFIREQRARERRRELAAATYQREQAASAAAASAAAAQR